MASVHVIRLDTGTPIYGIWCNACMTSGGFHVPIHRLGLTGVTYMITAAGCITCAGPGDLQS